MSQPRALADIALGRQVAVNYRYMGGQIDLEWPREQYRTMPLSQAKMRNYARIVRRAAIAEEVDPPISDTPACSICGRLRSCLAVP